MVLGSEYQNAFEGHKYAFPIAIFEKSDGRLTWRGTGQTSPINTKLAGIGILWFVGDNDQIDEWPLEINPAFVEVDWDLFNLSQQWEEEGEIGWASNGFGRLTGAQYSAH